MNAIETIGVEVKADGIDKTNRQLDNFEKKATLSSKAADTLTGSVKGLVAGYIGLQSIQALAGAIDKHTKYTAQLKLATRSQQEFTQAISDTRRIAQGAQTDIASVAKLYSSLSSSLRELNATQKEVAQITETVSLGLRVGGADASEAASVVRQLSQAFASGLLRGDEFNSMMENSIPLAQALAKSIGVTTGQLRQMAEDGELTSDVLMKAFADESLLESFRKQSKEINTISGSLVNLKNEFISMLGVVNSQTGASNFFAKWINEIADSVKSLGDNLSKGNINDFLQMIARNSSFGGMVKMVAGQAQGAVNPSASGKVKYNQPNVGLMGGQTDAIIDKEYARQMDRYVKQQDAIFSTQSKKEIATISKAAKEKADIEKQFNDENDRNIRVQEEARYQKEIDNLNEAAKEKDALDKKAIAEEEKRKKDMLDRLQKQANDNFNEAQKAQLDAIKEQERAWDRVYDNLSRSIVDSIVRGFEGGKSMIQNFKDAITNAFKSYVVTIGVDVVKNGIAGIFGGEGSAGKTSTGNMFGDVKSIFDSMNGTFQSSIENVGAKIADWGVSTFGQNSFVSKIGGSIGQYSAAISKVAPYFDSIAKVLSGDFKGAAFSAAGTAIGTAFGGPIGGAIGSVIGNFVGGMFGGKKQPKRTGGISNTTFIDGVLSQNNKNIFNRDMKASAPINQAVSGASESFARTLSSLTKMFGGAGNVSSYAQYFGRPDGSSYQRLSGSVDGVDFMARAGKGKFGDKDLQEFISKITGEYLAKAIQSTGVPQAIKKLFEGVTDSAGVQALLGTSQSLNDAQKTLASRFGLTLDNSVDMAKQLGLTGEALAGYLNQLSEAAQGTRTNTEVMDDMRTKLTKIFGQELPSDVNKFDEYIKSVDKTTEGGLKRVAELLSIRSAFVEYDNALDQFNNTLIDSATALGLINSSLYTDRASLQTAQALAGQGIAGIYNSTDANMNGKIMTETLISLRQGIALLIEESKRTSENTLTTARTLLNVTDGVTLLTSSS